MNAKIDTIEVDKETADTLETRAGVSVAQLVAEFARDAGPAAVGADEIAEFAAAGQR